MQSYCIPRNHSMVYCYVFFFVVVFINVEKYRFEGTPSHSISPIRKYIPSTRIHTVAGRMCAICTTQTIPSDTAYIRRVNNGFVFGLDSVACVRSADLCACVDCPFQQLIIIRGCCRNLRQIARIKFDVLLLPYKFLPFER